MSDFFGSINSSNVRFTDARINGDGPLPTNLSGPEGINGDPDGRYNFNDSLLSGIAPYAYGQGRMGADRNYQQIPHRKQFPVPPLFLPDAEWDADACVQMSHPIDMGDVVFIINARHKHFLFNGHMGKHLKHGEDTTMPQYNAFCNVCTVNYVLAGISNYVERVVTEACNRGAVLEIQDLQNHAWHQLLCCLKIDNDLAKIQERAIEMFVAMGRMQAPALRVYVRLMLKLTLRKVIRDSILPVGICSTSEKQGGQHEVGFKPVQAAASFFVTLTVDGQNRDLVNIWRGVNVEGGDQLTLHLEWCNSPQGSTHYVWNHYYKGWIAKTVKFVSDNNAAQVRPGRFQLVPKVFRQLRNTDRDRIDEDAWYGDDGWYALAPYLYTLNQFPDADRQARQKEVLKEMVHSLQHDQEFGFWHIGQSYTKVKSFSEVAAPTDDMTMLQGQLLQINFAPVWRGRTTGEFRTTCDELLTTDKSADELRVWAGRWAGRGILSALWCDLLHASLLASAGPYDPPEMAPAAKRARVGRLIDELSEFVQNGLLFVVAPPAQNAQVLNAGAPLLACAGAAEEPVAQQAKRFKKGAQEVAQEVAQSAAQSGAQSAAQSGAQAAAGGADWLAAAAEEPTGDWDFERELQQLVASDGAAPDAQKTGQQKARPAKPRS